LPSLEPPSTEVRLSLKNASTNGTWSDVLREALCALGSKSGRGWLDLHRYIWTASRELGYETISSSVVNSLQSALREFPEMPGWSFADDTAVANEETLRWLSEHVNPQTDIDTTPSPVDVQATEVISPPTVAYSDLQAVEEEPIPDVAVTAHSMAERG